MTKTIFSNQHKMIVERIKKARKEAGLEQNEVAKMMGKTQSFISKIESGQRRIDIVQLKILAEIFKKNLAYFIS